MPLAPDNSAPINRRCHAPDCAPAQDGDSRPWSQISQENPVKIDSGRCLLWVAAPRRYCRPRDLASDPPHCKASSRPLGASPSVAPEGAGAGLQGSSSPTRGAFRLHPVLNPPPPNLSGAKSPRCFPGAFPPLRRAIRSARCSLSSWRMQPAPTPEVALRQIDAREQGKDTLSAHLPLPLRLRRLAYRPGTQRFRLRLREQ